MKLECTVEEFKELLKDITEKEAKEQLKKLYKITSADKTTDVNND